MYWLQGIHLPDCHKKGEKLRRRKESKCKLAVEHPPWKSLEVLIWKQVLEFSRFCNSLRNISENGRRSLLLTNNSSSCNEAVSLYEKIWENDAVCVYHDLVCRRNPIKMMKKPHLCTSEGWAGWQSIHQSEGRRSTGRWKWLLSLSR